MITNFNAIYGDMNGVKSNGTRGPVSAVSAICVGPDEHVLTGPV